ncbi:MAG: antibiotic biosynthesis monooxygenase [Planctomycetota bacterium]|nr:antibiotic biosynthesis monooxygenase [Planctomycetota bacterium]
MSETETTPDGATVVITHRVSPGKEADYDNWLTEITPLCRASPGHLDVQVIRPIAGLTTTYTVVIRFDTCDHLRLWMGSEARRRLIERVRPFLVADDAYTIRSGLDFWFMPAGGGAKVPVRWKQLLVTWSAIYPLVLVVPLAVLPALRFLGLPDDRYLNTLAISACVVFLMTYVVMPHYTRWVRHWLFD